MVCARVIGNDATVAWAGASGSFELNVAIPIMGSAVLESIELLANTSRVLADKTIAGLEANVERAAAYAGMSPSIVTPLNKLIGYEAAAKIAKHSVAKGITVREAVIDLGYVDRGEPLTVAAVREAREECGLDVRIDGLVNIYSYPGRAPVIVVYAATAVGGVLAAEDECLETGEFTPDRIPWNDLAFRSTLEGLQDYLDGLLHPVLRTRTG